LKITGLISLRSVHCSLLQSQCCFSGSCTFVECFYRNEQQIFCACPRLFLAPTRPTPCCYSTFLSTTSAIRFILRVNVYLPSTRRLQPFLELVAVHIEPSNPVQDPQECVRPIMIQVVEESMIPYKHISSAPSSETHSDKFPMGYYTVRATQLTDSPFPLPETSARIFLSV